MAGSGFVNPRGEVLGRELSENSVAQQVAECYTDVTKAQG